MSEPVHISTVMREIMEKFKPNRRFKKKHHKLFKQDPIGANMFLLLAELADDKAGSRSWGVMKKKLHKRLAGSWRPGLMTPRSMPYE